MSDDPVPQHGERRLFPRYSLCLPAEVRPEGASAPQTAVTCNLSLCGCSIMVTDQLFPGIAVRVTILLDDNRISLKGRVITRHPQFGNGIMFLRFDADGEERLRAFLATQTPQPAIRP